MATGAHGQYLGAVEAVMESTYGTTPTNPVMEWLGYVQSAKNGQKLLTEDIKYLKSSSATTGRPDSHKNVQTGEEVQLDIEYIPQVGNMFVLGTTCPSLFSGAFCNNVTAPYTPEDTIPSYSIGVIDKWTDASTGGKEFMLYKGMMVQDFTFSVEVGTACRCNATLVGKELSPSDTTYVGSGTHASELNAAPLGASHISAVQMRSTGGTWAAMQDILNGIEIKMSNKIDFAKDLNSTATSKINAAVLTSRDITVSLDVDYYDFTDAPTPNKTYFALDDIIAFQSYDLSFLVECGTTDLYISLTGMKFPELPFDYSLEGIMGDKLTSLPLEGSATLSPIQVAATRAT
jgi:hypothetical protein